VSINEIQSITQSSRGYGDKEFAKTVIGIAV
jgi:hypothetical protein